MASANALTSGLNGMTNMYMQNQLMQGMYGGPIGSGTSGFQ